MCFLDFNTVLTGCLALIVSAHSLLGAGFYVVFTTGVFSACAKQTVQYSVAVVL